MKSLLLFCFAFALTSTAFADHTVTMRTTFADPAAASMKMTSVTRTKDQRQRVEDVTEVSGMKMRTVRLVMCDLDQQAQIDPERKIYTVSSLSSSVVPTGDLSQPAKVSKGTGKLTTHVKVEDKGVEKVAQVDARHWIVDSAIKGTGCIGNFDIKTKREFWTSTLPSFSCPVLNGGWTSQNLDGCQATNEMTGDVALFHESMKHQVVKEIIYNEGKVVMTREMVDFSTAALDDSVFSLDGYRKVSDAEFQTAQQEKMMKMYAPKP